MKTLYKIFLNRRNNRNINRLSLVTLLLLISLVTSSYGAKKDSLLTIAFGNHNKIVYNLHDGTYSVFFDNNAFIKSAGIETKGVAGTNVNSAVYRSYSKTVFEDRLGKGNKYVIIRNAEQGNKLEQIFYVYKNKNYFVTQLIVEGSKAASNYISPLSNAQITWNKTGDNRALFVPFDNDMWVRYNAEKVDSAHFTSSEATAIYNNENYNGIVIGSLEHEVWKSGININSGNNHSLKLTAFAGFSDATVTHDKLPHGLVLDNDSISASPKFMVGYFGDWRKGMDIYGKNNRLTEPPVIFNWTSPTPIGWNSWGVMQDKITLPKVRGVIDFFADSCKGFRTSDNSLFIDLDAFWDGMNHGNIDGNTDSLKAFVAYCNAHGFKPGIYWTPFTDWGKSDRKVEGTNYRYPDCWTKVNGEVIDIDGGRAIDPTHPATKERMVYYIKAFKKLGFKMIKIDFLAHGTLEADSYYDKNVHTGMQAFAEGMEYLDKQIGNSMLVYAAISPNMATARYVHMRRIACDAFRRIDETAYTLNSTTYGFWLSRMYNFSDADHVVFSDVTDGENRARLAAAVVTGSLITGDDYSAGGKWRAAAQQLLQNKELLSIVQYDGKSFLPLEGNTGKNASRLFVKIIGKDAYVAMFNYDDKPVKIPLRLHCLNFGKKFHSLFNTKNSLVGHRIIIPAKDADIIRISK
ncbi:hypothetical protein A9P82_02880 [Arachidicoccus ginsenosidimutans]|uniref:hypothetical protein n=1 Tax=Arachidicoccus sp. BS20 TaxID=1850526 RepID=UPI0007F075C5|nr:hypothetical protein [Arachidicoccus sp. BS20]ANI88337.1 hypothetical protein A9P82_02880 [Arachidicoccus sp. BS20]